MKYLKGQDIPRSWYTITKGEKENPLFTFKFDQDCLAVIVDGRAHIERLEHDGTPLVVENSIDMVVSFPAIIHPFGATEILKLPLAGVYDAHH